MYVEENFVYLEHCYLRTACPAKDLKPGHTGLKLMDLS